MSPRGGRTAVPHLESAYQQPLAAALLHPALFSHNFVGPPGASPRPRPCPLALHFPGGEFSLLPAPSPPFSCYPDLPLPPPLPLCPRLLPACASCLAAAGAPPLPLTPETPAARARRSRAAELGKLLRLRVRIRGAAGLGPGPASGLRSPRWAVPAAPSTRPARAAGSAAVSKGPWPHPSPGLRWAPRDVRKVRSGPTSLG